MPHLDLTLFGAFQAQLDNQPLTAFHSVKVQGLLAYLAVEGSRPHARESLTALFWPEDAPQSAQQSLRQALYALRRTLGDADNQTGEPFLLVTRQTVQFNPAAAYTLDVATFLQQVQQGNPEQAAALYTAELLTGLTTDSAPFEEWLRATRQYLHNLALNALNQLTQQQLDHGDYRQAALYARRQLALEPWREEAHRQVMTALASNGDRSAAIAQYELCCRVLLRELNVEPSTQTKTLFVEIRNMTGFFNLRPPSVTPESPYKGLDTFREIDNSDFLGRDAYKQRLFTLVHHHSFVAVIGASGSGKSSLVFAGLLPYLRSDDSWIISDIRLSKDPLHALAVALISLLKPQLSSSARLFESHKLRQKMSSGEVLLSEIVRQILASRVPQDMVNGHLLLVLDQFEELYTLCPNADQRLIFLKILLEPLISYRERSITELPLILVATLRADFMRQVLSDRILADALQDATLILGPMNRQELEQVIVQPAQKRGVQFQEGLSSRILEDIGIEVGRLPLLQFTLTQLWERQRNGWLTHAAYEEIGRVQRALANYAETIYRRLSSNEAKIRQVLVQMVNPGEGTEDTRRPASRQELGYELWQVVQLLADARLVVTYRELDEREQAEIIHEVLIESWERLRSWIDADRKFRAWQQRLRATLYQWQFSQRDPGALLRGFPLVEAEEWMRLRKAAVNEVEHEFIEASLQQYRQEQLAAEAQRVREIEARHAAEHHARLALIRQLAAQSVSLAKRQPDRAILLNLQAIRLAGSVDLVKSYLIDLEIHPCLAQFLHGLTKPIYHLIFSPDGSVLAAMTNDGKIAIWDMTQKRPQPSFLISASTLSGGLAFSPDSQQLAVGGEDGHIYLWDVRTTQLCGKFCGIHAGGISKVQFVTDDQMLVAMSIDGTIQIWNTTTGQLVGKPLIREGWSGNFSPDGRLAAINIKNDLTVRDVATGVQVNINPFTGVRETENPTISSDGKILVAGSYDKAVHLLEVKSGKACAPPFLGHRGRVLMALLSPEGETVASASTDRTIILWNATTGQPLGEPLVGHTGWVRRLAFSLDGKLLASGGDHGEIILWKTHRRRLLGSHRHWVRGIAFSPTGKILATGSMQDGSVNFWDVETGHLLAPAFVEQTSSVLHIAFSPNGKFVAAANSAGEVILWDVIHFQLYARFKKNDQVAYLICLAFSPDSKLLATGGSDHSIVLWDMTSHQPRGLPLTGHQGRVLSVAFSPCGRLLASGSDDGTVRLWDVELGKPLGLPLVGHTNWVLNVAFSVDGKILASGSKDNTVMLWDVLTHHPIGPALVGHLHPVWFVNFKGRTLITGDGNGTIIRWLAATGEPLSPPCHGGTEVESIAIHPNGITVALGGLDGNAYMLHIDQRPWSERACEIANRNLTQEEWISYLSNEPYCTDCEETDFAF